MSSLFTLADSIIGRIGFAAKFGLIIVLFLVPIGYLGGLQFNESRAQAQRYAEELTALDHLVAIRNLYEKVPQHRGLSQAVLKGNDGARGKLDGTRREVDARFARLIETDRAINDNASLTAGLEQLHKEWKDLQQRNAGLTPPQSFAQHTALIGGLARLMEQVADDAGLSHDSDQKILTQAVLEGVTFAIRDNLMALKAAGTELTRVTAVGGGSRSRFWLQVLANTLNLPVDIPAEGDFGAAFGAARLALIAATGTDPRKVCSAPATRFTLEPDDLLTDAYTDAWECYRQLYPAIRGVK